MGERGHDCEETALLAQLNHHHERAIVILDGDGNGTALCDIGAYELKLSSK